MQKNYSQIVATLKERFGFIFAPAGKENLATLMEAQFPEDIIRFYELYEPQDSIAANADANPDILLLSISRMLIITSMEHPWKYLAPYGFVVCAITKHGNAIMFDGRPSGDANLRIVKASYDAFCNKVKPSEIDSGLEPVAENFMEFLNKLVRGEIKPDKATKQQKKNMKKITASDFIRGDKSSEWAEEHYHDTDCWFVASIIADVYFKNNDALGFQPSLNLVEKSENGGAFDFSKFIKDVEKSFGHKITARKLSKIKTVNDLVEYFGEEQFSKLSKSSSNTEAVTKWATEYYNNKYKSVAIAVAKSYIDEVSDMHDLKPKFKFIEQLEENDPMFLIDFLSGIEKELNIEIPDKDIDKIKTIDDLIRYLYSKT